MITLYSGTPGSGKSLHASANLLRCINLHKLLCITNYEINREFIKYNDLLI